MKKVLLVTAGIFHPTLFGRRVLHRSLNQLDGFSFDHISSLEKLPSELSIYSAFVLDYHHKTVSEQALGKLNDYVKCGGGILAIHAATASFKKNLPYFEILGGRFTGHGPVERIQVRKIRDDIFQDIDDFNVKDELYLHELHPDVDVHFTSRHQGKDVPVVWTYLFGKGKVCYGAPGHTTTTMKNVTYQKLLQRALTWVTE
jgi:type 1 glutamine amidotransferase